MDAPEIGTRFTPPGRERVSPWGLAFLALIAVSAGASLVPRWLERNRPPAPEFSDDLASGAVPGARARRRRAGLETAAQGPGGARAAAAGPWAASASGDSGLAVWDRLIHGLRGWRPGRGKPAGQPPAVALPAPARARGGLARRGAAQASEPAPRDRGRAGRDGSARGAAGPQDSPATSSLADLGPPRRAARPTPPPRAASREPVASAPFGQASSADAPFAGGRVSWTERRDASPAGAAGGDEGYSEFGLPDKPLVNKNDEALDGHAVDPGEPQPGDGDGGSGGGPSGGAEGPGGQPSGGADGARRQAARGPAPARPAARVPSARAANALGPASAQGDPKEKPSAQQQSQSQDPPTACEQYLAEVAEDAGRCQRLNLPLSACRETRVVTTVRPAGCESQGN